MYLDLFKINCDECHQHQIVCLENKAEHPAVFCLWFYQELPEESYLHPPLTVFVVEHRAFGHLALVGSHVVQNLMNYAPRECGGEEEQEKETKTKGKIITCGTLCKTR